MYNNAKDRLRAFALNWKTITQRCKDAMAQRTKVSVCISLEFSVVPVLPYFFEVDAKILTLAQTYQQPWHCL